MGHHLTPYVSPPCFAFGLGKTWAKQGINVKKLVGQDVVIHVLLIFPYVKKLVVPATLYKSLRILVCLLVSQKTLSNTGDGKNLVCSSISQKTLSKQDK